MYQTQTITRRTIKRVENRLKGLGQLDLLGNSASGALKEIVDWITGKTGQLKVTATVFSEGMVKIMYGLDPDCRLPEPGIAIIPGNPTPRFCAGSIAGMIERCRLSDAQASLDQIKTQFAEKTRKAGTGYVYEEGQYVDRWLNEYGHNDFSNLATKITAARATCGVGGGGGGVPAPIPGPGGTFTCPVNWKYNISTERCDYVLPGIQTGISSQTLMIMAAAAAIFLFVMKR